MGVTTMGQEQYITSLHAAEDLTDGYFLTEAVTKYAERETQAEERMAQMETKVQRKIRHYVNAATAPAGILPATPPPRCISNTTSQISSDMR